MLPITFDLAKYPTVDTIRLLASLLERMTLANDLLNKQTSQQQQQQQQRRGSFQQPEYTRFHARLVPSIDIYSYLSRILKYCPCANECFLSLLVYFDRMSKNSIALTGRPFTIDSYNIHRLIIAGVMVSSKFFSDVFYTNTRYAKVGGLPVSELNCLELEFLKLNGFNLTVPISELQKYGDQLLKVGYMTQQQVKPASFRHHRSSSLDQTRSDFDRVCDLTQRMSLDEPQQLQQQQSYYQKHHYYPQPRNHPQQVRRMTSTNSLNSTTSMNSNSRLSMSSSSSSCGGNQYYEQPRHSRSSVNLHQGFWKPSSPSPQQQDTNRRLSLTSIHAPPFIPSSELQQQFYYPIGIPTPPPSASPIHYQQSQAPSGNSTTTLNTTTYPTMFL